MLEMKYFSNISSGIYFRSQFEFSFYTLESNGMLLIGNPGTKYDYEAVYMENGVLKYIFNAGSGYIRVESDSKYNDGKWHEVQTQRDKSEGNFLNHSLCIIP